MEVLPWDLDTICLHQHIISTSCPLLQAEHRTMAAFVLSVIVNEYPIGQVSEIIFIYILLFESLVLSLNPTYRSPKYSFPTSLSHLVYKYLFHIIKWLQYILSCKKNCS